MSRVSVVIAFLAVSAMVISIKSEEIHLYTDKYDYIDYDEILANDRIRNQYYNCYLGTGSCLTPDAKFFKDMFPEALVTKCKYCTEKQKNGFEKIVTYYTEKEPEAWEKVLRKAIEDARSRSKQ
ncbi:ejaculatory bulb-specific protein 3-like [Belonocnema kinseyi]|uniref:ejaculatory bulb-specific protein 3-like n=1 Tax=Belonocnema kinseyi TaxID=2817044 RepID=UPI00143D0228|nr:ejaculatory bulb-specific protein 3-like [Belonocnema kinseyi]